MLQSDFQKFAAAGAVERVVLSSNDGDEWEIWAYGSDAVNAYGNVVHGTRARDGARRYKSLDRAVAAIQGWGYKGIIEVERQFLP